jgi:hypothetical protein
MPSSQPAGLRRARGVIALARARIRATGGGRAGRFLGRLAAAGFAAAALGLRGTDGAGAPLSGLVVTAAHWVAWLGAAPLALAAAQDLAGKDRREGVDALSAARGVSPTGREAARALAAMAEIASAVGVPLVVLAGLTAALAGRTSVALHRASLAAGAAAFAVIAGVTLGGLGAIAGRLGRARGRTVLVALVVGPWVLADLAGHPGWSIPGALAAVLDFAMGARGGGA